MSEWTETLKRTREAQRLSQLELSLRLGVSQRHISFVENGRSCPSRPLLLAWLQELDAPLWLRNSLVLQAGYAPAYLSSSFESPALAQAKEALHHLLEAHDPMPAYVLDPEWNVLLSNRGAGWLLTTLLPWLADPAAARFNMLDLLVHPEGLWRRIVNSDEVGPTLLAHLRQEVVHCPNLGPKVKALAQRMGDNANRAVVPTLPILATRFASPHGELSFFSMFTTFGTPQDITLASLRVEHLFAADAHTRSIVQSQL